jgi:short-subunit dehydrogenase
MGTRAALVQGGEAWHVDGYRAARHGGIVSPVAGGSKAAGVVVVTGASRGIGAASAAALTAAGYHVVGTSRRGGDGLLALDVTHPDSLAKFVAALPEAVIGLVNNAGVGALSAAEDAPPDLAKTVFATNILGPIELTRLLLPRLRQQRGRIINIGSLIAEYPVPFHSLYAATKGALRAYTLAIREELRPCGVRVTLLEPGDIATASEPLATAATALYAPGLRRVSAARAQSMANAPPAATVGRVVAGLMARRRPAAIVAVGGTAPLLRQLRRVLPDRFAGRMTGRQYGVG